MRDRVADWSERARLLDVGGEDVAVFDVGPLGRDTSEPPLLVIHGFPTSSIDFALALDALSADRRVILLDLPGYGLSAKRDRAYSLFRQADVVEAVASDADVTEVDLLTHDMGDSVGGELLARDLDGELSFRVRRRVLSNGSIYLDLAQLTPGQQLLRQLPDESLAEEAAPDVEALIAALADLCAPAARDGSRDHLRAGAELVTLHGGNRLLPRLIRYLDERAEHEDRWTGAVERHPAPLAVVWGRHDPVAVAAMVDRLVERRTDTPVTWLDAGHWPMIEQPDRFAEAVLDGLPG
ncbi:MAG: alpha/beta fold hydrolase [Acidimicrobiales bacterium]